MKKITDYNLVVVDQEGEIYRYERLIEDRHQDCLVDYQKKKNYPTSDRVAIARDMGDALFYMYNQTQAAGFMPKEISDDQLYALEVLQMEMDDLRLLEIRKFRDNDYQDFCLTGDNIGEQFSTVVLQSYFEKENPKVR